MRCNRHIQNFIFSTLLIIAVCGAIILPKTAIGQKADSVKTLLPKDTTGLSKTIQPDSLAKKDSLSTDTIVSDSLKKRVNISDDAIKSDVKYVAKDSISFDLEKKTVKMYNTAQVNYEKIELKAAHITYGFTDNKVYATSLKDTAGEAYGKPIFTDNGQTYDSDTIRYNFKTKKGAIKGVYTKLNNDGHIYGRLVKKDSNDVLWIKGGDFCPCEDKDAKTLIHVNRIKVIPHDKIVTGAGYLTIAKIPTPLLFPFGYFPNQEKATAGILIPSYGESASQGFFLQNGGYYQPLGNKADLELRGDIYSKGSYEIRGESQYRSNYKHQGTLGIRYQASKNSFKELPDYTENRNYFLRWNHTQDPKARPNTSFSANVNVGSSKAFRANINNSLNDFASNTFNSGISYGKSWDGKPYNVSINANHSQNTQTRSFSVSLPNTSFNLARVFLPLSFLKNDSNVKDLWFEKIGFNLNSNFINQLNTFEQMVRFDNSKALWKDFKNGVKHTAGLSTSFKALNLSINPSINYVENWYFDRLHHFNNDNGAYGTEIENGFYRINQYTFNLSFSTQLYGMFTAKRGKISAIRHMMSPSATFFYLPEFNYEKTYTTTPGSAEEKYDPYQNGIFGSLTGRRSAGIHLALSNNLEMKVRTPRDTTAQTKKIKLIDGYNINASYDALKDSLRWSDISMNARTTLFKKININYSGTYTAYNYNDTLNGVYYNESLLKARGKLLRMKTTSFAVGMQFGQIKDQRIDRRKKGEKYTLKRLLPTGFPLTLNANYNLNLVKEISSFSKKDTLIMTQSLNGSGDIQLLRKIRIGYQSGYDFKLKKPTPTTLNIYWDLGCWEVTAMYVPFGLRKSYSIRLNMKSVLLKDLKLERKRNLAQENNLLF